MKSLAILLAILLSHGSLYGQFRTPTFRETYNVRAYGADDNANTDDTAAFQRAATAARATGGKVYVPVGTYTISSLDVSGITIEGESVTHTTVGDIFAGSILVHKLGATEDMLYVRPTDETHLARRGVIRNLALIGKRESNLKNAKTITENASSRTAFKIAVGDLPANDADNAYLASPYFGNCFFFSSENRYIGHAQVRSVNRTTGVVTLETGTDFYSARTGQTYLEAGQKVCFSEYTSETTAIGEEVGAAKRWDDTRAGYCAIDVQGISVYNQIENVYIYGFHCGLRKGNQLYNRIDNFFARACTLGGYVHAYPGYGSDDFCGTMLSGGIYVRDMVDGDTFTSVETQTYPDYGRRSVQSFRFGASTVECQLLIGFDSWRILNATNASNCVVRSLIADRSVLQSILVSGGSITFDVVTIRGNGLESGTADLIANGNGKVSIGQVVTSELDNRIGRNLVRNSGSESKTTILEIADESGYTGLQSSGDPVRANFPNGPYFAYAGNPNGNVTPVRIGEMIQDSANNKWYIANALTNSSWLALN